MAEADPVASVTVPAAQGALDGAWRLLLALANEPSMPRRALIGGLLVELHAHEHAATPPRLTDDADEGRRFESYRGHETHSDQRLLPFRTA